MKIFDWFRDKIDVKQSNEANTNEVNTFDIQNTTAFDLIDFLANGGDIDDFNLPASGGALTYTPLNRAITLLTGMISRVIVESLQVVDANGNRVSNPRAQSAIMLLRHSPDGITPAFTWHEDALSDLLTEGNLLALVGDDRDDRANKLSRALPWSSSVLRTGMNEYIYRLQLADDPTGKIIEVGSKRVIHARFGRIRRSGMASSSGKYLFAAPPIKILRNAVRTGIAADMEVLRHFKDGPRSDIAVVFEGDAPKPKQAADLLTWLLKNGTNPNLPLIFPYPGAKFVKLDLAAQSEAEGKLREFQVRDVTRIYGVPAPVLMENVSSWGQGIAELARMTWRFGARQHCDRYLEAIGMRLLRKGDRFMIDPSEFTRPDPAQLSNLINGMLGGTPYGTKEEARRLIGFPRDPDGEVPERREGGDNPKTKFKDNNRLEENADDEEDEDEER